MISIFGRIPWVRPTKRNVAVVGRNKVSGKLRE